MAKDIRHRQEHIEFLENYIIEITEQIDTLTGGTDIAKSIRSLEFRIEQLKQMDGEFKGRIKDLGSELDKMQTQYEKLKPVLEKLDNERAFYRGLQAELS